VNGLNFRYLALSVLLTAPSLVSVATVAHAATPAAKAAPAPTPPALEPKALAILQGSLDAIEAAKTLSFTATELFESLSRQGHPLASATRYEVTIARPDKLRVITPGDGPDRQFYYDGTTITAFAPKQNLFASTPAPPTIDAMLEAVYKKGAVYLPFTDLIVADPWNDLRSGLKLAYYVGRSNVIGGVTTDQVAYVGDGVFVQTWIGVDDKLPRLIRAVYLDDPKKLRHELALSDWKLNPTLAPDTFTPAVPANAVRVPFAPRNAPGPRGFR
jgi:hypothetical protein